MGRLSRKIRRQAGRTGRGKTMVIDRPADLVKMSAVLLDVAEPLIEDLSFAHHPGAYRLGLDLASLAWNASRMPADGGDEETLAALFDLVEAPDDEELRRMLTAVYHRCRSLYPHEKRMIAGVDVVPDGPTRVTVNVASVQ
jgi:hypothetical protein